MAELTQRELDEFREYAERTEHWAAQQAIRSLLAEVEQLRAREQIMLEALEAIAQGKSWDFADDDAKDALIKLKELEG